MKTRLRIKKLGGHYAMAVFVAQPPYSTFQNAGALMLSSEEEVTFLIDRLDPDDVFWDSMPATRNPNEVRSQFGEWRLGAMLAKNTD